MKISGIRSQIVALSADEPLAGIALRVRAADVLVG
jgi:hypothetical protein